MRPRIHRSYLSMTALAAILALLCTACGDDDEGSMLDAGATVLLLFADGDGGIPAEADSIDLSFLLDGNTIDSRAGLATASSIRAEDVPLDSDEVRVTAREGERILAEGYHSLALSEGVTTTVEVQLVERSCLSPGSVAKEIINQATLVTLIAGGVAAISDEEWESYVPPPPFEKNSDRFLEFTESCFYRSFDAPLDCTGDDCNTYVPLDQYSWLRLSQVACLQTLPPSDNLDRVPPPGFVQVIVLKKCQELVFEGEIFEMHDPYGNVYVMHASPDGQPDPVTPQLPEGWHIESRVLTEPLVLNPRGEECRYTLVKDDQDQSYHQYIFDGSDGLESALSPECAALLDEN